MALPQLSRERCIELTGLTPEQLLYRYDRLDAAGKAEVEKLLEAEFTTQGIPDSYIAWLPSAIPPGWNANAPHIQLIGSYLDRVTSGEIDRLAVHAPPRHAKSDTITVRYPVYHLLRNPTDNVLVTGYNERFARRLSRRSRIVAERFGILDNSRRAADEWYTKEGGMVMSRGVGSPPTGVGFQVIIVDDPLKSREDAESDNNREKQWDWYIDDLYTRLEPGGVIIIAATLWHEDDICYRAVASEPDRWTVLKLPALAEPTEECPDILGRAEGEALWPTRWPVEALMRRKAIETAESGERSWNALYQCRPAAREGDFFEPDKIVIWTGTLPPMRRVVRAWDLAATKGAGDYTVGMLVGIDINGGLWVLDIVRGRYSSDERRAIMRSTAERDGFNVQVLVPQDPAAAGKDVALDTLRLLIGYNVKIVQTTGAGSKESRAFAASAQVNGGNFKMVKAKWNLPLKSELRGFPSGKFDDQVDCISAATNELGAAILIVTDSVTTVMPQPDEIYQVSLGVVPKTVPINRRGGFVAPTR